MSKDVYTRRDFLRDVGIGVAVVSTLQISNNASATTHNASSIDELPGLKEFKEYAKNVVDAMKNARAYAKPDYTLREFAELLSREVYNGVIKGRKVIITLVPLQQGELLGMYVDFDKPLDRYSFNDYGIEGHLMGNNAGFLIYDKDNMEILNFVGSGVWYHFEKVIEAKKGLDRLICLRPATFNPTSGYCPIGDALFDEEKQIFEREGYYTKFSHEYFIRRINEAKINRNSLYREILTEMIKELRKTGQIK